MGIDSYWRTRTISDANVVWFEPSASKRWIEAFGSGSTPRLPDEPMPTNSAAGAQCTELVRHPPDAVLIRDQHVAVPPGKTIWAIEIFDMALDEGGAPATRRVTQPRAIARNLLRQ